MASKEGDSDRFTGFDTPEQNWFRMPNQWTDITAGMKSLAELKVVEYVLRHTWGYREYGIAKRISINEFMNGRLRSDGTRIDRGTGLSNRSVIDGLRSAVEHGFLTEERNERDRGRIQKSYQLRMKNLHADVKNLHRGVKNLHTRGKESSHRTEKDTQERNLTVNGGHDTQTPVRHLPDLDQSHDQADLIARDISEQLGDDHSQGFYRLVAQRIPESVIYRTLSEIRSDGADAPPKVFTFRMNRYALEQLNRLGS